MNSLAAIGFLNVDLTTLDTLVRRGKLTTKMDHDSKLYKLDDVLAIGKVTAKEVLDRHWPVDRRKKPTRCQQKNILKTKTERDSFTRRWFRLQRGRR